MSKDFAKEYKDAVVNDLPNLWDRIEAALPADVNATSENEPIEFKKPEENKEAVVNSAEKPKKKKKKLVWLYVSLPAAAVLLMVIVPLGALLAAGVFGLTSKTASNSAPMAASSSNSYKATADVDASLEAAPEAVYEDAQEEADYGINVDQDTQQFASGSQAGSKSSDSQEKENFNLVTPVLPNAEDITNDSGTYDPDNGYLLANYKMKVRVDGTYTDDAIGTLAELTILQVAGKNNEVYYGFSGFNTNECVKAKPEGFDHELQAGEEYWVSIYLYVTGDYWVIKPAN